MALSLLVMLAAMMVQGPRWGLALNVPEGGGEKEYLTSMRQQIRMGLDGGALSIKWDEMEQQAGKPLADGLNAARIMGQRLCTTISTIDTNQKRLPADLISKRWDDPDVLSRFEKFLEGVLPKIAEESDWLSLGNEVDVYLEAHPEDIAPFLTFLQKARQVAKRVAPKMNVGVTTTCVDGQKHPQIVDRLIEGMDIAVFTYYPTNGFSVNTQAAPVDFAFMLKSAGGKPLVLQELGCPASPLVGSSDEKQAQFVRDTFALIDKNSASIPLVCFFLQVDFSDPMLDVFEQYYGIKDARFRGFLGSLGFIDAKGQPRKAWDVLLSEMAKRRPLTAR